MTRQAVTKHLSILESANLVSWKRRGREKLHFINPVPINEIAERWINKFEQPRLRALSQLKKKLEGNQIMNSAVGSSFIYVTGGTSLSRSTKPKAGRFALWKSNRRGRQLNSP